MNTKLLKFFSVLSIIILLQIACSFNFGGVRAIRGTGDLVTESRQVSGFDSVDLRGSGEVIITQGDSESLTVETDENLMQYVTTEVRGGTLHLGFDDEGLDSYSPTTLKFTLTAEELSGLSVSGSGDIATDSLETSDLDIRISGSGEVQIGSLTADSLDVQINGSGEVDLAGDATTQSMGVSGSAEIRAGDLKGEDVEVDISGSGAATVWATESLDVSVSGSGSVGYYGNPTIDVSSSGSGGAKSLGDK